jgi:hypothetical protein
MILGKIIDFTRVVFPVGLSRRSDYDIIIVFCSVPIVLEESVIHA